MTAVLQRIRKASVVADGVLSGEIGHGLYILLGVESGDDMTDVQLLSEKIAKLRIFEDDGGKMNLSVQDVDGEIMVVSNFTLAADYSHGNRPSYIGAAAPAIAEELYNSFVTAIGAKVKKVATGKFGADMQTDMQTDGPVTIVMHSSVLRKK